MPRLRVLAVAQAFKGTLAAESVAAAFREAATSLGCDVQVLIGSDGGDGLLAVLGQSLIRRTEHRVTGPLGSPVVAEVGWLDGGTAVVESRLICGLGLVPAERRDPLLATTRGVGEILAALRDAGAAAIVVGLGGSATVDGGTGMARALGWHFLDGAGRELAEGGGSLAGLHRVVAGARVDHLLGLADVRNPLAGPDGAIVYAPQKGARGPVVERLAVGLDRLAAVTGSPAAHAIGAGAAGGLGFGLMYFAGATVVEGGRWVLDRAGFAALLAQADAVVTGEGAFDATSRNGKLAGEVLGCAVTAGVPTVLVAPRVEAPAGRIVVETGGGHWDVAELTHRARRGLARALRLPVD